MSEAVSMGRAARGDWPPGPRGRLPGGALLFLRRHPEVFLGLARRFGDVVYFRVGRQRVFLLSRMEDIDQLLLQQQSAFVKGWGPQSGRSSMGDGLAAVDGELHRRDRRLLQPLFSSERNLGRAPAMAAEAARLAGGWRDGEVLNIHREMQRLTLAVIGRTLLGCDTLSEEIYSLATNTIAHRFLPFMLPWPAALRGLDVAGRLRLRRVRRRLDAAVRRVIEARRGAPGEDLVAWLTAQAPEGEGATARHLRDHFVTFLLAGHETTALALTWSLHLLAQHPEAQAALEAEVDGALADSTAEDALPRLDYTRRVVADALRLYPPQWMLGRRALRDVELADYRVPAGSLVLASPYITHRDPRYFAEPLRFDPDRWDGLEGSRSRPLAYFPFGLGARRCIGEQFALTEAVIALATITRRWRLRPLARVPVRIEPLLTLRPRGGLPMQVTARR